MTACELVLASSWDVTPGQTVTMTTTPEIARG